MLGGADESAGTAREIRGRSSPPRTCFRSQISAVPFSSAIFARMALTSSATATRSRGRDSTDLIVSLICEAQRHGSGDDAGAGQRQMLPRPGRARLIVDEARELGRHRPLAAGRPQPHVHFIERAFGGLGRERRDQALGEAGVVLRARQAPFAVGVGVVAGEIVHGDRDRDPTPPSSRSRPACPWRPPPPRRPACARAGFRAPRRQIRQAPRSASRRDRA